MDLIKSPFLKIRSYTAIVATGWTLIILLLLGIEHYGARTHTLEVARIEARTSIEKDLVYRRWNAVHGGVYVPITADAQPNPYLQVPNRDVTTTGGLELTLMNPAYMTRQVLVMGEEQYGFHAHLTSLDPIRPLNAADPWETQALEAFERGETEISSLETMHGGEHLRLMLPFFTEEPCLKCHGAQGYEIGDIRGGLSVSIPMSRYAAAGRVSLSTSVAGYATLWLLGVVGIYLASRGLTKRIMEREQVGEELRKSETKFRTLAEFTYDWEYWIAPDGSLVYNSPSSERITGYSSEEFVNDSQLLNKIIFPEDQAALNNNFVDVTPNAPHALDFRILTREGDVRWISHTCQAVFDEEGQWLGRRGSNRDITGRKQAEEELQQRDKWLTESQRVAQIGSYQFDIKQDNWISTLELDNIFGIDTAYERTAEGWLNLVHPEQRDEMQAYLMQTVLGQRQPFDKEYRILRPADQQERWVHGRGELQFDENGSPMILLGTIQDITERKKADEALRESEERFSTLAEAAFEGIGISDKGRVVDCNEQLATILGYEQSEMIGLEVSKLVAPESLDIVLEHIKLRSEKPYEHLSLRKNGTKFPVEIRAKSIPYQGRQVRVTAVRDITERKRAEDDLRKLSHAVEQSNVSIVITDTSGKIEYVNPYFSELTGYTSEEAIGQNPSILQSGLTDKGAYKDLWATITGGKEWKGEFSNKKKNGELYWESASISPITDSSGVITHFVAIKTDITERKRSADTLRASEERFRLLADNSTDMISRHDPDGVYLYVSPACRTLLGYEPEELVGHPAFEFIHPDDIAMVDQSRSTILTQPITSTTIFRIRRKDGQYIWFETTSHTITDDEAGVVTEIHAATRDVTERKVAEMALRESEERLRAIVDAAPFGAHLYELESDECLVFIGANHSANQILNVDHQQFIGKTIEEAFPPLAETEIPDAYRRVATSGERFQMDQIAYDDAGISGAFEIHAFKTGEGRMAVFFRDITERKRSEEALQISEDRYRRLAENAPDIIFRYVLSPVPKLEYINPAVEMISGYTTEECYADPLLMLNMAHPEDAHLMAELTQSLDPPNEPIIMRWIGKDGVVRWLESRLVPVHDGTEQLIAVEGLTRDITERKRAEEKLAQQLEHLRALHKIDQAIATSLDLKEVLDLFVEEVAAQLHVDAVSVLLLDQDQRLNFAAGCGFLRTDTLKYTRLPLGQGLAGRAAAERQIVHVDDLRQITQNPTLALAIADEEFVAYYGAPLIAKDQVRGVLEVFHRSPLASDADWLNFLETLAGQAAISIDNASLFEDLQQSSRELHLAYDATLKGWSRALDLRDKETEGHTQRVTETTLQLASKLGVSEDELTHIQRGALLHDIGKMGVPDSILLKPGPLTDEEWTVMRKHPELAYEMLLSIQYLHPALDIPHYHHERWDGSGYPSGLKGEDIPLAARIFAVVDVWDALRSDRPYRRAWPKKKVIKHIQIEAGKYFDPHIVEVFLGLVEQGKI